LFYEQINIPIKLVTVISSQVVESVLPSDSINKSEMSKNVDESDTVEVKSFIDGKDKALKALKRAVEYEYENECKSCVFLDKDGHGVSCWKPGNDVSMSPYYIAIGESEKAEKFDNKVKKSNIDSEVFDGDMSIKEWLTVDEVEHIIDYMLPPDDEKQITLGGGDNQWIITQEHRAMFETLYYTGCRVGELPLLDIDDFNFEDNSVHVYRLKKSGSEPKRDMIAVPDSYMKTMKSYLDIYNLDDGDMFRYGKRTIQDRVKDISEAYIHSYGEFEQTESLTPHKVRHARVTAIANNSSIDKAGEFVDHSSLETTKAYRHLAVEEQRDILPEEQPDEEDDVEKLINKLTDKSDNLVETIADKSDMSTDEAKELVENAIQ